jgi:hypothetical protein
MESRSAFLPSQCRGDSCLRHDQTQNRNRRIASRRALLLARRQLDVLLSSNEQNRAVVKKSKLRCCHAVPRVSGRRRA